MVEKQGHCYSVQSDQLEAQVEEVFWYFNVQQDDKYLFSRCQACNGDKYATLTSYQAQMIHQSQKGSTSSLPSYPRSSPRKGQSDYDLYGDFLDDSDDSDRGE